MPWQFASLPPPDFGPRRSRTPWIAAPVLHAFLCARVMPGVPEHDRFLSSCPPPHCPRPRGCVAPAATDRHVRLPADALVGYAVGQGCGGPPVLAVHPANRRSAGDHGAVITCGSRARARVARGRGPCPSACLKVLGESPQMPLAPASSTGPVGRVRTRSTGAATTSRHGAAVVRPLPARRVRVPRQAAGSRQMPRRARGSVVGDRLSRRAVQPSRLPPRRTGPWISPAGQVSENSCPVVAPLLLGHLMPVRKTADPSRRLCRPVKQHSPRGSALPQKKSDQKGSEGRGHECVVGAVSSGRLGA